MALVSAQICRITRFNSGDYAYLLYIAHTVRPQPEIDRYHTSHREWRRMRNPDPADFVRNWVFGALWRFWVSRTVACPSPPNVAHTCVEGPSVIAARTGWQYGCSCELRPCQTHGAPRGRDARCACALAGLIAVLAALVMPGIATRLKHSGSVRPEYLGHADNGFGLYHFQPPSDRPATPRPFGSGDKGRPCVLEHRSTGARQGRSADAALDLSLSTTPA